MSAFLLHDLNACHLFTPDTFSRRQLLAGSCLRCDNHALVVLSSGVEQGDEAVDHSSLLLAELGCRQDVNAVLDMLHWRLSAAQAEAFYRTMRHLRTVLDTVQSYASVVFRLGLSRGVRHSCMRRAACPLTDDPLYDPNWVREDGFYRYREHPLKREDMN